MRVLEGGTERTGGGGQVAAQRVDANLDVAQHAAALVHRLDDECDRSSVDVPAHRTPLLEKSCSKRFAGRRRRAHSRP
jgi:hypothetical protein